MLYAHPVRGESHNQRNATGDVATVPIPSFSALLKCTNSLTLFRFFLVTVGDGGLTSELD